MSVRRLSAAGLAALGRAVNDPATVERFRVKGGARARQSVLVVDRRDQRARARPVLVRPRGLVSRKRADDDRRRYVLTLTSSGASLLALADAAIRETERDLLSALDEAQVGQLHTLLRRVADGIDLCPADDDTNCP